MRKTRGMKRAGALLMALALVLALAPAAWAAETAATMQLTKTEGTVSITNASGRSISVREKMRLYSGYTIKTDLASYAWVALDDTKLVRVDSGSEIEVHKNGKSLELLVESGALFFNVTEPLKEDEKLNICTSTMVAGIRGTSGWTAGGEESTMGVLEGTVQCESASGGTFTVNGGECVSVSADGAGQSEPLSPDNIPGFALSEVASSPELQAKLGEKVQAPELREFLQNVTVESANARMESDVAAQRTAMAAVESQKPAGNAATMSVETGASSAVAAQPSQAAGSSGSSSSGSDSSSGSSGGGSSSNGGGNSQPNVPVTPGQPENPSIPAIPLEPAKPIEQEHSTGNFTVTGGKYGTDYSYSDERHVLNIKSNTPLTISGHTNRDRIAVGSYVTDVDVTFNDVTIDANDQSAFQLFSHNTQNATITLANGSVNTLTNSNYGPGLCMASAGTLTITGNGTLNVVGSEKNVGIGSNFTESDSDYTSGSTKIKITGGIVNASGDGDLAGIGYKTTVSVTIDGDAFVHIKTGETYLSPDGVTDIVLNKGIVFFKEKMPTVDKKYRGAMKGSVTLPDNVSIPADASLTIPEDAVLIIPKDVTLTIPEGSTLNNNGKIVVDGTILNYGSCSGISQETVSGSGIIKSGDGKIDYSSSDNTLMPAAFMLPRAIDPVEPEDAEPEEAEPEDTEETADVDETKTEEEPSTEAQLPPPDPVIPEPEDTDESKSEDGETEDNEETEDKPEPDDDTETEDGETDDTTEQEEEDT